MSTDREVAKAIANLNSDLKIVHAKEYLGALKMNATNVWFGRLEAKAIEFANLGGMSGLNAVCNEVHVDFWDKTPIYLCYIRLVNMVESKNFKHDEAMKVVSKYVRNFNY